MNVGEKLVSYPQFPQKDADYITVKGSFCDVEVPRFVPQTGALIGLPYRQGPSQIPTLV